MITKIYYFTGSGNSYATAKLLARGLGDAELVHMGRLTEKTGNTEGYGRIGFVFPVVGGGLPKTVDRMLRTINITKGPIYFAVCTCGISPGHSLLQVDKWLNESALALTYGFSVLQPQSGIGSRRINSPEGNDRLYTAQRERAAKIVRILEKGAPGTIEKGGRFSEFLNRKTLKALPTMVKLIGQLITRGVKNMTFHATEKCVRCGTCVGICPVGNIAMDKEGPLWGNECAGCMGCYHWCPQDAVRNVDLDMIQSPHPDVEARELMKAP